MSLLLWCLIGLAQAQDDCTSCPMNDVGATLNLPSGWRMTRWSDWDFKAKSRDGGITVELWLTPFQVDVSEESAEAWAQLYIKRIAGSGGGDAKVQETSTTEVEGRPWARSSLSFRFTDGKGPAGNVHAAAYTSSGQVVHLRVLSTQTNSKRALRALDQMMESLEVTKEPLEVQDGRIETEAGFAATLPSGWRAPLPSERGAVEAITSKVGRERLPAEECWTAILPPAKGDPDVMFACSTYLHIGPVDEHSFEGEEPAVREHFFKRAEEQVPPAERVTVGDRTGFLYRAPGSEQAVRLALAPYSGGMMTLWAIGTTDRSSDLDAALITLLPKVEFTGNGGGKPIIGVDKRLGYWLKYRPSSPVVWGPVLIVVGLIGFGVRKSRTGTVDEEF